MDQRPQHERRKAVLTLTGGAGVSVRLVWPFLRATGTGPADLGILARAGIQPESFARPETRIPHRVAMQLIEAGVRGTGDRALGLRAGEQVEAGDFEVLEYAARSCPNLRQAIHCVNRYLGLMHDGAQAALVEEGEVAIWRYRIGDADPQPAAVDDFVVAAAVVTLRRWTGIADLALEVHLQHEEAGDPEAYTRIFRAPVRHGRPYNAVVLPRALLDAPMLRANSGLSAAFQAQARWQLQRMGSSDSTEARVRQLLASGLSGGVPSMETAARALTISVATLRRRLQDEGTSFSRIVDETRWDLAQRYLRSPGVKIGDVAFLLGFSHAPALHKAFRRWATMTPREYRARVLEP
jgi:AraC-like DNA-binding protein